MAFPQDILDTRVEAFYSTVWNPVTQDVRGAGPEDGRIVVLRGRADEDSRTRPTACRLALNNRDGRYSPRNPSSPLFGLIGRNTPLRVSVGEPHVGAGNGDEAASTSHVAPSVDAAGSGLLLCAWGARPTVDYTVPGTMTAGPETDGDLSTTATATEVVASGATGTRTATASVSSHFVAGSVLLNGAAVAVEESLSGVGTTADGSDVALTTAATTQTGWWLVAVQRWAWFVEDTTRFFPDAPQDAEGGWVLLADSARFDANPSFVHRLRMWARRVRCPGEHMVTFFGMPTNNLDNHAHLYVLSGVDTWWPRATVEVSAWPPRWDVSGSDVWVPLQGSGILRRLGQGAKPLHSTLRRTMTGGLMRSLRVSVSQPLGPIAYWPLEDAEESTTGASAVMGGHPFRPNRADRPIGFGERDDVPAGSDTLPSIAFPSGGGSGAVDDTTSGQTWVVSFLVKIDGATEVLVVDIGLSSGPFEDLTYTFSGSVNLAGDGSSVGTVAYDFHTGDWQWVELSAFESAGTVTYRLAVYAEDGSQLLAPTTFGTASGTVAGNLTSVSATGQQNDPTSIGHVAVWPFLTSTPRELARDSVDGHTGEPAGRRAERLCGEEMVPFHPVGDLDTTTPMGPQRIAATFLDLLRECQSADLGLLYEPRETLGLAYRTRRSLYNQAAVLELDYAAGELAPPLDPTEDDQATRNDVTVRRSGGTGNGSTARAMDSDGPLGTQTIGRYDTTVDVNVPTDLVLPDQASWRLHLGTVDEARFPLLRVQLHNPRVAADPVLFASAAALDVGDRLTVDNPPVWLPPDQITQLAQGFAETLSQFEWDVSTNNSPESPYHIAEVEHPLYSTLGSDSATLDEPLDTTETGVDIDAGAGPEWVHEGTDYDVLVGGERMTVTAVGAATGTFPARKQTLTVVRSVNGVVKTHPAGARVEFFHKSYIGL